MLDGDIVWILILFGFVGYGERYIMLLLFLVEELDWFFFVGWFFIFDFFCLEFDFV